MLVSPPIYVSANGDRWRLVCDDGAGRVLVRHEANPASGGHVTETEARQFLQIAAASPEREAVLAMLAAAGIDGADGGAPGVRLRDPAA